MPPPCRIIAARYLDYEGPVSGNRGEVKRWDFGEMELLSDTRAEIVLRLFGRQIEGQAVLTKIRGEVWTFRFISKMEEMEANPDR